jgi:hypothetical protein
MADQYPPRFEKNLLGDWYTTGECMACGAPEAEAPELLAALSDIDLDTYFVRQPATAAEVEHACRAAEVCCVAAIRYGGRDPSIIRRLGNTGECCDVVIAEDGKLQPLPPGPRWQPPAQPRRRKWWQFFHRDRAS